MRQHSRGIGPRRYFTMTELSAVWKSANRRGILYNGMTFALLREKYRRPIYHKPGVGFYFYPASPKLSKAEAGTA